MNLTYFIVIIVVVIVDVVVVANVVHVSTVTRMLRDGVVVVVVDDAELAHHVAANGGLQGPVVSVGALRRSVETFDVDDLRVETLQDDAEVLDAKVVRLFHR
jgi:hypothetical protein